MQSPLQRRMRRWLTVLIVASMLAVSTSPTATAQIGQPDIIQEHWYHSYATLTLDINEWADDYPEIVNLLVVGQTEMGRNLWMLQIWFFNQIIHLINFQISKMRRRNDPGSVYREQEINPYFPAR